MNNAEGKNVPSPFFQNQPSYTHFNKSFDDPADALFLQLNDVHPIFWKTEQLQNSYDYHVLLDPRTNKEVTKIVYDHTEDEKPHMEILRNERYSKLNKRDHITCLRVLLAWQEMTEINEEYIMRWRRQKYVRQQEKVQFDKLVREYEQRKKATIYAPTERLVKLYKYYYAAKLKQLLKEYPENLALNTHAGLPLPQSFRGGLSRKTEIGNVRLLRREGWVPVLKDNAADLVLLNARLENYMEYYVQSIAATEQELEWNLQTEDEQKMQHHYYLPLESLLFLLTAGNAPDLPTEVALEIDDDTESGFKVFKFKQPLPARHCGWNTHKIVVEKALEALMSASEETRWLFVENDNVKLQEKGEVQEINAAQTTPREFKAYECNEYMQKYVKNPETSIKANSALIEWRLSTTGGDAPDKAALKLYTQLKVAPAKDSYGGELLSCYAMKLEYKPQFGAELMHKYELLEAWVRLKLTRQCKGFSEHGLCRRLAVCNFKVQLEHNLMLGSIEQQLHELYQIQMPQLLTGLADTLQLLANMPKGKYFLRYNPKYQDKLLLAKHSTELTPNTVFLHTLLNAEPTDLLFMTNVPHLPISDTLCTVIHKRYRIIPCAFKPILQQQYTGKQMHRKVNGNIKSDEEWIQTRLKGKLLLKQEKAGKLKRLQNARKRKMKADRLRRTKKQEQVELARSEELLKLINEC